MKFSVATVIAVLVLPVVTAQSPVLDDVSNTKAAQGSSPDSGGVGVNHQAECAQAPYENPDTFDALVEEICGRNLGDLFDLGHSSGKKSGGDCSKCFSTLTYTGPFAGTCQQSGPESKCTWNLFDFCSDAKIASVYFDASLGDGGGIVQGMYNFFGDSEHDFIQFPFYASLSQTGDSLSPVAFYLDNNFAEGVSGSVGIQTIDGAPFLVNLLYICEDLSDSCDKPKALDGLLTKPSCLTPEELYAFITLTP
jgi:hypothetical protein